MLAPDGITRGTLEANGEASQASGATEITDRRDTYTIAPGAA